MYSTCLFCYRDLGRNEFVEHFQVGRRLAFDAAKGRLWVVCRGCERWNLTPLEERWEAIEECERAFSDTKLRVSTDNIGLARVREGLELVRIGAPKRPEMAAWRYGDQFGRRRRRHMVSYGIPSVAVTAFIVGDILLGGIVSAGALTTQVWQLSHRAMQARRARTRLRVGDHAIPIGWSEMQELRLVPTSDAGGWSLVAPQRVSFLSKSKYRGRHHDAPGNLLSSEAALRISRLAGWPNRAVEFQGGDALNALRKILPFVNPGGGSPKLVSEALHHLEQAPSLETYFSLTARRAHHYSSIVWSERRGDTKVGYLPPTMLLALEMAAHEETEREAMHGELARLEDEWRDAEEIAAIADNMFMPDNVQKWIDERRPGVDLSAGNAPADPRLKE